MSQQLDLFVEGEFTNLRRLDSNWLASLRFIYSSPMAIAACADENELQIRIQRHCHLYKV